ncbi:hypothetical protein [Fodinibius sp. SL11]|uniref:hypothetical protein n=1 Tax=Fodinibius sp. SL11 TaxID=3425690 RepID=UPI003F884619
MITSTREVIEFAMFLTGHDKETITQMYNDWMRSPSGGGKNSAREVRFNALVIPKTNIDLKQLIESALFFVLDKGEKAKIITSKKPDKGYPEYYVYEGKTIGYLEGEFTYVSDSALGSTFLERNMDKGRMDVTNDWEDVLAHIGAK